MKIDLIDAWRAPGGSAVPLAAADQADWLSASGAGLGGLLVPFTVYCMDLVGLVALLVSLVAVVVSARLAITQNSMQKHANTIPSMDLLLGEFRSEEFWRSYNYVCTELADQDSGRGIAGLPAEARSHVYSVCYLFQHLGDLVRLGVVDERAILSTLRFRVIQVWAAVEPFVVQERRVNPAAGPNTLRLLEAFAARAEILPAESYSNAIEVWLSRPMR
ncbi:hypothetical protein Q0Z83_027860 [Actinoplanes sichuanensis]|uniref:Uncharacterized protein n=1 Tax=Actinoplanes sichuanensis TaxID=512349 RepID=A0ABW4ATP5_9ACTN|nr:hypothetical protein [Actinoplanes sichuanensis]BEL04595.1 hypothetical protein Q0Z83_027860 [Actinoplanes sichuanensis]